MIDTHARRCIFCGQTPVTREHLYPRWLFEIIELDQYSFKPSRANYLTKGDQDGDQLLQKEVFETGQSIPYKDFTLKVICESCNNGWMSELEGRVKNIMIKVFGGEVNLLNNPAEAYDLSIWAIIKSILLARVAIGAEYEQFILRLLKNSVIPEGFIVEACKVENVFLNYQIGNKHLLCPVCLDIEQMMLAQENFLVSALQIGNLGIRVSYLKTAISVNRFQIIQPMMLIHPFGGRLPFYSSPSKDFDANQSDVGKICDSLIFRDGY